MLYLEKLVDNAKFAISKASNISTLDKIRVEYLGKKGHLTLKTRLLSNLSPEERPSIGLAINEAKKQIQHALNIRKIDLNNIILNAKIDGGTIDVSLPGRRIENGNLHPVTRVIDRVISFFIKIGFIEEIGLEIEDSYHNFDALNIPMHHPVRSNHDTFWFDTKRLLRTQTSGVQIHTLKNKQIPTRIITSGRVYRNNYDKTHTPMFHQIEGLMIDRNVSFSNLKGTLSDFLFNFFEEHLKIRFRPSYFPFTEPSMEIDIMDKNGKWLEVLGCGMVHPKVLYNVGINSEIYSGFAFGIGIERLTMLRYGISDLRNLFENDIRFLKQFK